MGCVKKLFALFVVFVGFIASLVFGPNALPGGVEFTEFAVDPMRNLGAGYQPNELLNNVERMFEDEIKGPEAFAVCNGDLYTTLHGGYVAKIYDDQVIPVVKFGEPCEGWWEESKCGRPLGIKAVGNDLFIADAYYGIIKYNVKTKQFKTLVDKDVVIDGKHAKTFNSLDVASDGSVYWSHSSSHFTIEDGAYTFLADGSGRLMKYDPKTNSNKALMDNLFFANGVLLSPGEDFVLVAETGHSRIIKYHLKGPKKFTREIFIDGLPGVPDNLRAIGDDRIFVSLYTVKSRDYPILFQTITDMPWFRKFLAAFMSLVEFVVRKADAIYPNDYYKGVLHQVGHLESLAWTLSPNTTLLEVNWSGDVVRSYHGSDGSFSCLSDVMVHNGYLYLGSPTNTYLGRVPLTKLGEKIPISKAKRDTRPPPSTTTPRPAATARAATKPPQAAVPPRTTPPTKPPPTTSKPPTQRSTTPTTPTPPPRTATTPPPPPTTRNVPKTQTTPPPPTRNVPKAQATPPPKPATPPPPPPPPTRNVPKAQATPPPERHQAQHQPPKQPEGHKNQRP